MCFTPVCLWSNTSMSDKKGLSVYLSLLLTHLTAEMTNSSQQPKGAVAVPSLITFHVRSVGYLLYNEGQICWQMYEAISTRCYLFTITECHLQPDARVFEPNTWLSSERDFRFTADEAFGFVWQLQIRLTAVLIESVKQKRPVYPSPGLRLQMLNIGWLKRFMKCLRSSTVIIILNAGDFIKACSL